ncbi:MAG: hypothetical protein ABW201_08070 [Candidatus Thiodiazotropha sp.]
MANLVDLDHKWAILIGRVFIAFGSIERTTHECLKKWLEEPVYPHVKHMKFSSRVDLLIDVTKKQKYSEENTNEFVSNLKEAKELAKKRNLIAHNPLMLCLFQGEGDFVEAIASNLRDDLTMEFHELEDLMHKSEELASSLIDGTTKFRLEGWEGLPITSQASGTPQSGAPS